MIVFFDPAQHSAGTQHPTGSGRRVYRGPGIDVQGRRGSFVLRRAG